MAEDSSRSDPRPADPLTQSKELIEKLFRNYANQAWIASAIKGDKQSWGGSLYREDRLAAFDPQRGHYIANCMVKAGSTARNLKTFEAGVIVVADDVGYMAPEGSIPMAPGAEVDIHEFRMFAPETSFEIETSQGNHQMAFAIWPPERSIARWAYLLSELRKTRFGKAFAKTDAVHYGRLPSGSNQPKTARPRFKSRFAKSFSGKTYSLDELALAFGITLPETGDTAAASGLGNSAQKTAAQVTQAEICSMETLHRLIGLLPNDKQFDDRSSWIAIGAAIRNISEANGCPDEGLGLWLAWCAQRYQDDGAPERLWDSVYEPRANAATLRKYVEARYGGKASREYQSVAAVISQDQAREAFEKVEGEPGVDNSGPDPFGPADAGQSETQKATKDFIDLLREARRLVKIPDAFRNESDDENWLHNDDFENAFDAIQDVQPASPTLFPPFDRGVLSVRAGAPFSGKSLLLLDQMAAFCCERADLLGVGFAPVQFAGDVLYFCNEDSRSVARRRLQAWHKRHGNPVAKHRLILVRSNLMSLQGDRKPTVIECVRVLQVAVRHLRKGHSLPMIVFDTMRASVAGMEENSTKETAEAMELLKAIARAFWAAVIFVHHGTKQSWNGKENEAKLSTALAGSGNFGGTVRGADVVRVLSDEEKIAKSWIGRKIIGCQTIKASDDDMAGERFYEIETVQIQVKHAERVGVLVMKGMPVAVPLVPVARGGFIDEKERQEQLEALDKALARGTVWRAQRATRKPLAKGEYIHEVWKMPVARASEIVDSLVAEGVIKTEKKDAGVNEMKDQITLENVEDRPF